ncbi:HypC/HybG/HupF family hydrogenase formation chaperone [Consotaella salsifontis]|uniref:Hydrogenase maturation factor HypC n=1 Tax=Consotaella salsifontis TaxID=1365950 RepID=A0A1T4RCA4_9HYPH|nr:HypC/HybG/HupF family hydrogenase formation chaperone [Consotaella salsifontis]SKA13527.1 Hydrogenase maturation protein HypC [Consotaella salsifontis]
MCLAIPAEVVELLPASMARVNIEGVEKVVSLALVENVAVGDYVLLHVGFALSRIDPEEALQTLAILKEMGELVELEESGAGR